MAAAFFAQLPSIPYPPEQDGRWSPVTSTLDWCEEVSNVGKFVLIKAHFEAELCRHTVFSRDCQHIDKPAVHVPGCKGHSKLPRTWP